MELTEKIEMEILGILGIFGIIALIGVLMGNQILLPLITTVIGIFGGYLGNQVKGQLLASTIANGSNNSNEEDMDVNEA